MSAKAGTLGIALLDDEKDCLGLPARPANDTAAGVDMPATFASPTIDPELSGYVVEMAASLVYLALEAGDEELARRLAYALRGRRTPNS